MNQDRCIFNTQIYLISSPGCTCLSTRNVDFVGKREDSRWAIARPTTPNGRFRRVLYETLIMYSPTSSNDEKVDRCIGTLVCVLFKALAGGGSVMN